ncbi:hypothetical protein CCMSSC00406_0010061 [Pleurotus cornucopiae]|uniref:Uncharacterized protein n=1 Tax=Pleurotus cornucopiae TaxID=5321 RepID=A0ACB7IQ43_PLECO|nr:hypothetical protein CCMSSC00406_0010061 [Pleurotus cornucopiae]
MSEALLDPNNKYTTDAPLPTLTPPSLAPVAPPSQSVSAQGTPSNQLQTVAPTAADPLQIPPVFVAEPDQMPVTKQPLKVYIMDQRSSQPLKIS